MSPDPLDPIADLAPNPNESARQKALLHDPDTSESEKYDADVTFPNILSVVVRGLPRTDCSKAAARVLYFRHIQPWIYRTMFTQLFGKSAIKMSPC